MLLLASGWGWLAAGREADALRAGRGDLSRQVAALGGELEAAQVKSQALARQLAAAEAQNASLAKDASSVRIENERLVRDLQSAQAQSERLATAMAVISAPGMKPVALAALKAPPGAQGYTFVDPRSRRAVFVAANLPALAAGKTYELWFIADGKPVAAGTFGVDAGGRSGTVEVKGVAPIDRIQAWAVTVEPRGGVPQPTGPMVLKG
jgi:anti-sigma-K factor RskA